MKLQKKRTVRMAFTLVELLVVIAIIIVLASLLLAAVFKALDLANEAATRTDVTQLSAAVESFKTKYQVSYIPSRLVLCKEARFYYAGVGQFKTQLHQDSYEYLNRVWPRLGNPAPGLNPWDVGYWNIPQPGGWSGIDWDSSGSNTITVRGQINNPIGAIEATLEGSQCLVFFLGGIPGSGTVTGFSTNQSNPAQIGGDRVAPFFEFKSNRLVPLSQWAFNTQGGNQLLLSDFYAYLDGYGRTPYAYFSSYKTINGYNRYFSIVPPSPWVISGLSDCQSLGVWPYAQSLGLTPGTSPTYLNAQTYQIISAGKNTFFGAGGNPTFPAFAPGVLGPYSTWAPSYAGQANPQGTPGYDDIANFYDRLLGVPTQ
jgi:type II secretory pathway pseudopilin PulG